MTNIIVLKSSPKLGPYGHRVKRVAEESLHRIQKLLPVKDVDIVLYDNPEGAIPHLGIGGYAPSAHVVFVSLNPGLKNFNQVIDQKLLGTLAHELHHTVRWSNPGYGETLLEALVTEGLADHFEMEVTKSKPQAWDTALSSKDFSKMDKLASRNYYKKYNHSDWFFGSQDQKIPKWTGYTLGFRLVENYLQANTHTKASKLYSMPAKEFL